MEEILIIREEDFWEKEEALQHIAEALFKSFAKSLDTAVSSEPRAEDALSTKGCL